MNPASVCDGEQVHWGTSSDESENLQCITARRLCVDERSLYRSAMEDRDTRAPLRTKVKILDVSRPAGFGQRFDTSAIHRRALARLTY
jgi:hypothetical protein